MLSKEKQSSLYGFEIDIGLVWDLAIGASGLSVTFIIIMAISGEFYHVFLVLLGIFSCFIFHFIWISLFPFVLTHAIYLVLYISQIFFSLLLSEIICSWLLTLYGASAYAKHLWSFLEEEEDVTGM